MTNYLLNHLQACLFSLGLLVRQRVTTLLSGGVIAVSLALPAGLYVALATVADLSRRWEGAPRISVYLKQEVTETQALALAARLRQDSALTEVEYISADAALAEFKQRSGFGEALDLLDENPLPAVLVVRPRQSARQPGLHSLSEQSRHVFQPLIHRLAALPEVDQSQFDLQWLRRLTAIVGIGERVVGLLATLLGVGVLLIVGNTIRLAIYNRRDEIEISKLIGGTDAFIRRPFLYSGLQQGLFGGALAALLVYAGTLLLTPSLADLAGLYDAQIKLVGLGAATWATLVLTGGLLGWLGAWAAVSLHLREIEPA